MFHLARTARRTSLAVAAVSLCLVAGACGGGDGSASDSDTSSAPPSSASTSASASASSTSTTSATDSTATSSATPLTDDQVAPALLVPDDIQGYGFTTGPAPGDSDSAPPCAPPGSPGIDSQVPPQAHGGTELDNNTVGASIIQQIQVYDSPDKAAQAFGLLVDGLNCSSGTLSDGTTVKIKAAGDVTAQVNTNGVGKSTAWQLKSSQFDGIIVATLSSSVATDILYLKVKGADESQLPNPLDVSRLAFQKILAN